MSRWTIVAVWLAGCALAGSSANQGQSDAPVSHHADAHTVADAPKLLVDAPHSTADAKVFLDAAPAPDAPSGGGICSDNTMCGAGTCCFVALCVPGQAVGKTLCFPH